MGPLEVHQVIQGLSVPAFMVDVDHKVKSWNKACEELTGLKEEELLESSDHWRGFYFSKKETLADVILKGAHKTILDHRYPDKWNYLCKSQEKVGVVDFFPKLAQPGRVLSLSAAPLKDSNGQVIGVLETVQDITDQYPIGQELKYSRDNFRELMSTLKNIIYQLQAEKDTLEQNVTFNIENNILPYVNELAIKSPDLIEEIDFIKKELNQLCSSFYRKMVTQHNLSPSESKVLNYVKMGLRDKEIALQLNVALATVKKHKISIRKKLNISKNPISLSAYLNELT